MNENKKSKEIDMIHGPLLGKMVAFTVPIILTNMLQLLFNAADVIVVGNFAGDEALAAVGSTGSLINLILGLFMGLSVGANVIVAHFIGSGEKKGLADAVHSSILLGLVSGIAVAIAGFFASGALLQLMKSPDDVIGLATIYLKIYFMGAPASLVYNFATAILRAKCDTKTPMLILIIAGIINAGLNLILVIAFSMGVAGVAIATIVSQYISAIVVLLYMSRDDTELRFDPKLLRFNPNILGRIVRLGLPAGIQGMVFSLSNVVIQSSINSFQSIVMAGNSAAMNLEGFVYMAMNSVYQTSITFVGQNVGAGDKKRVLKATWLCQLMVTVVGLTLGMLVFTFRYGLLGVYTDKPEVIEAGALRLAVICTTYFLCGTMDSMVGALRGLGQSIVPMIVSLIGACGLRLIWIATLFQTMHEPFMLYITYPISWIITWIVHILTFVIVYRKWSRRLELAPNH